jgi:hypothetical protein
MAFTMELHAAAVLFLAPVCSSLGLKCVWKIARVYIGTCAIMVLYSRLCLDQQIDISKEHPAASWKR